MSPVSLTDSPLIFQRQKRFPDETALVSFYVGTMSHKITIKVESFVTELFINVGTDRAAQTKENIFYRK